MNAKGLLRVAMFGFLAVAIVMTVRREIKNDVPLAIDGNTEYSLPADGLVVYYFHGNIRCPTCQTIESYAREAVETRLASELARGQTVWRVLNYETSDNAHYVNDYEIAAPTVVLVERENNQDGQSRNLMRVWELVGDKSAFIDYVAGEATDMMAGK